METCRDCGIELESDVTNPLALCIDCELKTFCPVCNEPKGFKMFDIDGTNLEEHLVCVNTNCSDYEVI